MHAVRLLMGGSSRDVCKSKRVEKIFCFVLVAIFLQNIFLRTRWLCFVKKHNRYLLYREYGVIQ